jgi:DNA-binding CsgD family transcriptional regulator
VAQLTRALRAVAAGRTWFGESDWVEAPLTPAAQQSVSRAEDLSEGERRVLALVAAGASTEEIGSSLNVSPHTVRTHVRNLMKKLDAQSRAHAVAIAMRESALDL